MDFRRDVNKYTKKTFRRLFWFMLYYVIGICQQFHPAMYPEYHVENKRNEKSQKNLIT